jgi:hypothetical protein
MVDGEESGNNVQHRAQDHYQKKKVDTATMQSAF